MTDEPATDKPRPKVWAIEELITYRVYCEEHGVIAQRLNYREMHEALDAHKREHA